MSLKQFVQDCKSTVYTIQNDASVTIQERGPKQWCIRQGALVMNIWGGWEPEPYPDFCGQEFADRTHWKSPEEAYEFYRQQKPFLLRER
jgi:hypothetical protein